MEAAYYVAVIGAGPAGLFAAKELINQGVRVAVFNRDIKPGGLVEYGIYPDKHKMKEMLRQQFRATMENPKLDYYGNVVIANKGDFTFEDLQGMGFDAIIGCGGSAGDEVPGLARRNP